MLWRTYPSWKELIGQDRGDLRQPHDGPFASQRRFKGGFRLAFTLLIQYIILMSPPLTLVNQIVDSICEQFASYRHLQLIKWILLRYMRDVSRGGGCVRNNLWVSQTLCFVVSISCTFFLPRRNRNRGRIFHAAPHLIRMFLAQHYFIRFCYAMEWRMKDMLQLKGWRWYQIWSSNQNQNSREHEFDPCPSLQAL